ncbi:hypothetical protein MNBD_BACTEROID05-593 [hydrothermal vent metagenome]|uniref:Glycosyltransferase RgtA/B/C/D-like domain-containing protein n=1 Tax=hydrothermal vent metagenome TaxID=652676 RepID=A0A3B0T3M6_9ZZZZ
MEFRTVNYFTSSPLRFIWIFILFLGLVFGAYHKTLSFPFVHDDVIFIQQNSTLDEWNLSEIFLGRGQEDKLSESVNSYYRPVLEIYYRVINLFFGRSAAAFHFFNIFIHALNGFLVFLIVHILLNKKNLWGCVFVAALFLLHPIQTEAVACISGVSNLLSGFFILLSFYLFERLRRSENKQERVRCYVLSLMMFVLALLSKEQAVILPFLALSSMLFLNRDQNRQKWGGWKKLSGFFAVMVVYFGLRRVITGSSVVSAMQFSQEFWLRIFAIPRTLLMYLKILFFPVDLHYYRSTDILESNTLSAVILLILVAGLSVIILKSSKERKRLLTFSVAWFIVCLLPFLNFLPLVNEYSLILTSEHFLYLPIIGGLFFFLVLLSPSDFGKVNFKKEIIWFFLIALFFFMSMKQSLIWRGEIPLFKKTLVHEPNFGRVRFLLGKAYLSEGKYAQASIELEKSLIIMQSYLQKVVPESESAQVYLFYVREINGFLGLCFDELGQFQHALKHYQRALSLSPENPKFLNYLGFHFFRQGEKAQARQYFQQAVDFGGNDVNALNILAICYIEAGQKNKAMQIFKSILDGDPSNFSAQQNLFQLEKSLLK